MNKKHGSLPPEKDNVHGMYLGNAPHLSGESAALVADLLRMIADEIDREYAAQVLGIRSRAWLATPAR